MDQILLLLAAATGVAGFRGDALSVLLGTHFLRKMGSVPIFSATTWIIVRRSFSVHFSLQPDSLWHRKH
jgi:hypothetical protein